MAELKVTYSRVAQPSPWFPFPIAVGSVARCEVIAIATASAPGQLTVASGENVVELRSDTDCWIVIGTDPTAAPLAAGDTGSGRFLAADTPLQLEVTEGDKVAVATA